MKEIAERFAILINADFIAVDFMYIDGNHIYKDKFPPRI
jgi:hypothetical protein